MFQSGAWFQFLFFICFLPPLCWFVCVWEGACVCFRVKLLLSPPFLVMCSESRFDVGRRNMLFRVQALFAPLPPPWCAAKAASMWAAGICCLGFRLYSPPSPPPWCAAKAASMWAAGICCWRAAVPAPRHITCLGYSAAAWADPDPDLEPEASLGVPTGSVLPGGPLSTAARSRS